MNILQVFTTNKKVENKSAESYSVGGSNFSKSEASEVDTPESSSKDIYFFGKKNNFPDTLIKLYNKSGINQAVINRKSLMISGNGVTFENEEVPELAFKKALEDSNILRSLALNYTLFNSMYLCGTWSIDGKRLLNLKVLESSKIRKSLSKDGFWFCRDWNNSNKYRPEYLPELDLNNRVGRQILSFERETIGMEEYPLPIWYSANNWINIDIGISEEYLSSLETGFSPKVIIEFMQRPNKQEDRDKIVRNLHNSYSGSKKSKIMALFSPNKEMKTNIQPVNVDNLSEQYQTIVEHAQSQILTAHGVTSPLLMGIKTSGQLGGATELAEAYNIFNKSVIRPDQRQLERLLNRVCEINELSNLNILEYPIL